MSYDMKNILGCSALPPAASPRWVELVMSGIAGIDTWYRYRYQYLGIERGIDT